MIRPAVASDAEVLARIYNHYVLETPVTFEEEPVSAAEMARRLAEVDAVPLPWLVVEDEGAVAGYAYASPWKRRVGYRFAVETTVYLDPRRLGRGLGTRLYEELLLRLAQLGLRVAIGGVALPNAASVALHEKLGFRKVAHFERVGLKFGRWIDVAYWQLALGPATPTEGAPARERW